MFWNCLESLAWLILLKSHMQQGIQHKYWRIFALELYDHLHALPADIPYNIFSTRVWLMLLCETFCWLHTCAVLVWCCPCWICRSRYTKALLLCHTMFTSSGKSPSSWEVTLQQSTCWLPLMGQLFLDEYWSMSPRFHSYWQFYMPFLPVLTGLANEANILFS